MKQHEEIVDITPEDATCLLSHNDYIGQRKLRSPHVAELARKMDGGVFHIGQVALVHTRDRKFLADGQHQLHACIRRNKPFKAVRLDFVVEPHDSEIEVAKIFGNFNVDYGRVRGDVAWNVACRVGLESWGKPCVALCSSALSWLESGVHRGQHDIKFSRDEAAEHFAKHYHRAVIIRDIVFKAKVKTAAAHMRRSALAAAMVQTNEINPLYSYPFWEQVRDGLNAVQPALDLRDFLLTSRITRRSSGPTVVTNREMYVRCVTAWNIFRGDPRRTIKYMAGSPIPRIRP